MVFPNIFICYDLWSNSKNKLFIRNFAKVYDIVKLCIIKTDWQIGEFQQADCTGNGIISPYAENS